MSKIQGLSGTYDRNCMSIHIEESNERALKGNKFVFRFKVPEKYPVVHDIVYGDIDFSGPINIQKKVYDDPIIIKSDTFPTYHFASVVDDYLMNITHVIRGEEWLSSTSKHLAIYQAFGWTPPRFAHVSLLVNPDGSKISKRCKDTHIQHYIDEGYSSDALLNYVALIGWSPKTSNDVFTMQELIDRFSLDNLTKGTAIVMPEKLNFLNKEHFLLSTDNEDGIKKIIKKIKPKILSLYKKKILEDNNMERLEDEYIYKVIVALRKKVQNINQLIESSNYFFVEPHYNEHILNEFKLTSKDLELTLKIIQELNKINLWNPDEIISTVTEIATAENIKIKKIKMILRFCCTATIVGADIIQILYILGKKSIISRINKAMEWNKSIYHE
ncbi:glutamate-tRNA ligase [Pneumocystis carinii B80]|uniref:Glutamate-tRNA ligase n=1 Tax=Pneumocystis carinii (strain B80) TaxID=1408658 RepID=A0A0W4ZMS8_PNEC8|nr:glutamate-tRNA ligase [Pneumocystis carinii B80]KTW29667.1 glutamate-tRNA ligase [Pneumocystis carinii B80]